MRRQMILDPSLPGVAWQEKGSRTGLDGLEKTFMKKKSRFEPKHGRKNAVWPTKAPERLTKVGEKQSLYMPEVNFSLQTPHPTGVS